MSKDFGNETLDSIANAAQNQIQVNVDDTGAHTGYGSQVFIGGSAEEIVLNFAGPLRPTGPKAATMKVEQRIIMNPWAAKRLAMALNQTMERYEQTYGPLELDERKRRKATAPAAATTKLS
jgi:hypothetical protein